MKPESSKKLDKLLRQEKLKKLLRNWALIPLLLAAAIYAADSVLSDETREIDGHALEIRTDAGYMGQMEHRLLVRISGGKQVLVSTNKPRLDLLNQTIILEERTSSILGLTRYRLKFGS